MIAALERQSLPVTRYKNTHLRILIYKNTQYWGKFYKIGSKCTLKNEVDSVKQILYDVKFRGLIQRDYRNFITTPTCYNARYDLVTKRGGRSLAQLPEDMQEQAARIIIEFVSYQAEPEADMA